MASSGKYCLLQSMFKFNWDQVVTGFWQRYPNPESSHVLSEDVISRHIKNGKLYSKRVLTKTNKMPKWGERFYSGPRCVCVVEESVVDPKNKTLVTYTRNVGLTKIMTLVEKCVYKISPENKQWTCCLREAWVSSELGYGLGRAVRAFGIERFKSNVNKTMKGYNYVLEKLYRMPTTELPPTTATTIRNTARKATEIAKAKAKAKAGQTMVAYSTSQTTT